MKGFGALLNRRKTPAGPRPDAERWWMPHKGLRQLWLAPPRGPERAARARLRLSHLSATPLEVISQAEAGAQQVTR